MLGWRIAVSAVLIPVLVGVLYLDALAGEAAPFLFALSFLVAGRSVWELFSLLRTRSFEPNLLAVSLATLLVVCSVWASRWVVPPETTALGRLGPVALAYAAAVLGLFGLEAVRFQEPGKRMETLGVELVITSYAGLLLAVTVQLRWVAGAEAGYLVLGSLLMATKAGDVGAYFVGRLFGQRKMTPRLSPGKTWAGAAGALAGAGLGTWAWMHYATPAFNDAWTPPAPHWSLLYGVVIGAVGMAGDLCESLIKRDVGRKDSAQLLPGFGGVLDLLDSVLYAGPVAWILWQVLPLATWTT